MAGVKDFLRKKADFRNIRKNYDSLFENIFISRYKINGLDYQENKFLLEQLYLSGTVALLKDDITNITIVSKYTTYSYNQYRYPYRINLIGDYEGRFKGYVNNEEAVTIFATYTREPVRALISQLIDKLSYIDIIAQNNLLLQNIPFLLTIDDDSKQNGTDLLNRILNLDIAVIQKISSTARVSAYNLNAPYLLDKLNDYKNAVIGEILTILGINNNQTEKRERLVVDEVNANNEFINTYYNLYYDNIQCGLDKFNELFNDNLRIIKPDKTEQENPEEAPQNDDIE